MELKIKDITKLLQVSEKTIYRWIKEKKIPCYRIHHQYRFNKTEINEWILSNKIEMSSNAFDMAVDQNQTNLTDLLRKGGVYAGISGTNVSEVLYNAIKTIPSPDTLDPDKIATALVNREQMMTTAIGHGIAIPHPRNPIITNSNDASVSVCYLQEPVDFGALDKKSVHTLFIQITFSPRRHLEVLSKISYLCQLEPFRSMLAHKASEEELLNFIQKEELQWKKKISVKS